MAPELASASMCGVWDQDSEFASSSRKDMMLGGVVTEARGLSRASGAPDSLDPTPQWHGAGGGGEGCGGSGGGGGDSPLQARTVMRAPFETSQRRSQVVVSLHLARHAGLSLLGLLNYPLLSL